MFNLTSENLTNLGGPMGTEHTFPNWTKHFTDAAKAKTFAETDYEKSRGKHPPIKWKETKDGFNSGDLGWVMYHINEVQVES